MTVRTKKAKMKAGNRRKDGIKHTRGHRNTERSKLKLRKVKRKFK